MMRVSEVRFITAAPENRGHGHLGWVSFSLDGSLRIDGVSLRRTLDGRLRLSFPFRRDGCGVQRFYVRPMNDRARREVEAQVFRALGIEEENRR